MAFNGVVTQTPLSPIGVNTTTQTIPINTNVLLQIRIHDRAVLFMYNGNIIGHSP